jgi:hypothetical protein
MYNFKQLTGSSKFLSYKDWAVNDFVVGKIERFQVNSKNPKVQDVVVIVLDSNIKKEKVTLVQEDTFTINGTTALQKALDRGVEEGDIIKVVYLGKEPIKTGTYKGQLANKLDVFVAPAQDQAKLTPPEITSEDVL